MPQDKMEVVMWYQRGLDREFLPRMGPVELPSIVTDVGSRVTSVSRKVPFCSNLKRVFKGKNIMSCIQLNIKTEGFRACC